MVLTSWTVLVLVILHLHASDTRREEGADSWIQEPVQMKSSGIQISSTKGPSPPLHRQHKVISREDEDLLDLMVRIAESPAEWERIHRVLNQLGTDQTKSPDSHKGNVRTEQLSREYHNTSRLSNERIKYKNNLTENYMNNSFVRSKYKNDMTVAPQTPSTETTVVKNYVSDEKTLTSHDELVEPDTGWPDFREAILKNVLKHNRKIQENKILEKSWIKNRLFETAWSQYSEVDKENQRELDSDLESNVINPVFSFKQVKTRNESNSLKDPHIIRSRLYQDPNILEFPLKGLTSEKNHTFYQNTSDVSEMTNKSSRPTFLYHRVTTSPQERKNSAFIAVSVVKQSSLAVPTTDSSPVAQLENTNDPWTSNHYLHWAKGVTKSLDDSRKTRPHLNRQGHHHNRGRRHHHTELHGHL